MTTTKVVLFDTQSAPATDTEMYASAASGGTTIDKMTATNTDSVNRQITVRLVPPTESPTGNDFLIVTKTLVPDQCYLFPEIVGQMLSEGGAIWMSAEAAGVINVRASGREET